MADHEETFVPKADANRRFFRSRDYGQSRTKQSFKDLTDINKIMAKAQQGDAISHLSKYGAQYGDFSDIGDLLTAHERLQKGVDIFNDLPSELKREFAHSPKIFFEYVNSPEVQADPSQLQRLFPRLAQEGDQQVRVRRTADNMRNHTEDEGPLMDDGDGTASSD